MNVVIYHLFPDLLNLYGDFGNIVALKYHLESLGINVNYKKIFDIKDFDKNEPSFVLIGGGSDREQTIATKRLKEVKDELEELIENNLPILAVCGGFQFLGKYYNCLDGTKLEGLGIFDIITEASTTRMVGNIIVNTPDGEVIGFENHSGETFHSYEPLGEVIVGYGNTTERNLEGFKYKNVIGTYMHGPILPKNSPLIKIFVKNICEYAKIDIDINKLNFEMEDKARNTMIQRVKNQ
ncbi:MAG: type 1 glutamine amidotransferase [Bacilli bacterium]